MPADYPFLIDSLFPISRIIRSSGRRYLHDTQTRDARGVAAERAAKRRKTTMRKTILTILAASLMAALTAQIAAAAAEHHHVRKAPTPHQQFRNANNAIAAPAQPNWADYSEGHVISAPAGH